MLRFEWSAFVTPDLIALVATEGGVPVTAVEPLAPLIAQILGHAGGLPFVDNEPSLSERTAHGMMLLAEAAAHTVAEAGARHDETGYVTVDPKNVPFGRGVVALSHVHVNSAGQDELTAVPGMTSAIVSEVIAERRRRGRFATLTDLERRVDGIGPVKARAMGEAFVFDTAAESRRMKLDERGQLGGNLRTLIAAQPDDDRSAALRRALEMIATACATAPHPATRDHALRSPLPAAVPATSAVSWVGVLWSDDYWTALPELLASATRSIDVCMFHIAAPRAEHPTRRLLEALRQAHQRGVAVRVLLDSDEKTDPYQSTVINANAKRFLEDAGIACRSDLTERLLHSKYVILDSERVVLGSHNWSAGSYFDFDDLTLVFASSALASEFGARFEALWASGH